MTAVKFMMDAGLGIGEFGGSSDVGAVSIPAINDGPFFTMVALGMSGIAQIPVMMLLEAILAIIVGCVLGNPLSNPGKPGLIRSRKGAIQANIPILF